MSKRVTSACVLAAVVAFGVTAAHATVITYSSQAAFNAATTGVTTFNIPAPSGAAQQVFPPYTIGPLSFSSDGNLFLVNDGAFGAGQTVLAASPVTTETINANGSTALSFIIGIFTGSETLTIDVNGVFAATLTIPGGQPLSTFFGLTSTSPVTVLTITASNPGLETDILRFQVGSAGTVVPEPASFVLVGSGLLGFSLIRRRKQG